MRTAIPLVLAAALLLAACGREDAIETPGNVPAKDIPPRPPIPDRPQEAPLPSVRTYPTGEIPDDPRLAAGYNVYRDACMVCHDRGATNAPVVTNVPYWRQRIDQGKEAMYRKAIEGHTGERGFMPPKGGSPGSWTDDQVRAAVDYMIYVVNRQS